MDYGEQLSFALSECEGKHGRVYSIGMTPAMYSLIKEENERHGMPEPEAGWKTFRGAMIEIYDISKEPIFCIGGVMYKAETPVDPEKVMAGLKCHVESFCVDSEPCKDCPYLIHTRCTKELCKDVLEVINELRGSKT